MADPRMLFLRSAIDLYLGRQAAEAVTLLTRARARDPRFLPEPVSILLFRARMAWVKELASHEAWEDAVKQTMLAVEEARKDADPTRRDQAKRNLAQLLRKNDRFNEA